MGVARSHWPLVYQAKQWCPVRCGSYLCSHCSGKQLSWQRTIWTRMTLCYRTSPARKNAGTCCMFMSCGFFSTGLESTHPIILGGRSSLHCPVALCLRRLRESHRNALQMAVGRRCLAFTWGFAQFPAQAAHLSKSVRDQSHVSWSNRLCDPIEREQVICSTCPMFA